MLHALELYYWSLVVALMGSSKGYSMFFILCMMIYGGFHEFGTHLWMVDFMESSMKVDDLGVTPISGNPHIKQTQTAFEMPMG